MIISARVQRSALFLPALLLACSALAAPKAPVQPAFPQAGLWRGEFDVNGDPLPFEFEIKGTQAEDATFTLINGSRRDDFKVQQTAPDTLFIKMNTYDAAIEAKIESPQKLVGVYKSLVPSQRGSELPFVGEYGKAYRFVEPSKNVAPAANLSGKWAIEILSKEAGNNQVALLQQDGNRLGGVFMTVVGDTRELAGTVQGNEFYLSGFTGPSPVLIKGTIEEDGSLNGIISRGIYRTTKFLGYKSDAVELPDPYKLTYLKPGYTKLDFTFPDLDGNPVSLSDEKYRGKVVIVEIIGSWCPNCTDQTRFLAPWYKANKHRGVEIIAIAFEQEDSLEYARYTLGKLREFFDIEYDILFGGIADKRVATEKLGALNFMAAFPTTIVIDRKGDVREIYTGYTGEITGEYFKDYVRKFNENMDALLAEPVPADARVAASNSTLPQG
jgi:peroxiredoxin